MLRSPSERENYLIATLIIATPLSLALVRRSATPILVSCAILLLVINWSDCWRKISQLSAVKFTASNVISFGVLLIVTWGLISLSWSPLPSRGATLLIFNFFLPIFCGGLLLSFRYNQASDLLSLLFLLSVGAAAFLVIVQIKYQFRLEIVFLKSSIGLFEKWRFNMVVVSLCLFIPVLLILASRFKIFSYFCVSLIIGAATISESATAKAMITIGFVIYFVSVIIPRKLLLKSLTVIVLIVLFLQPMQGSIFQYLIQNTFIDKVLFQSARDRVKIWQSNGIVAVNSLPFGAGIGASTALDELQMTRDFSEELRFGLKHSHPHNALLNVWLELGILGVIGISIMFSGIIILLFGIPPHLFAPCLMLLAQILIVALVSHGAWQAWWYTAILISVIAIKKFSVILDEASSEEQYNA